MSRDRSKLRILWHSVSPAVRSGYGTVTRYFPPLIKKHGFTVIISAYYGLHVGQVANYQDVPVLPAPGNFGQEGAYQHYHNLKCNLAILHSDWWAFGEFPKIVYRQDGNRIIKTGFTLLYSPADHEDYPKPLVDLMKQYDYVVPLCNWTARNMDRWGVRHEQPIYHGVDTDIYYPMDRDQVRETTKFPKDKFIIGIVSANEDKDDRKAFYHMFKGFSQFIHNNPDVKDIMLLVHANPMSPKGLPLHLMADYMGISEYVRFPTPYRYITMFGDNEMRLLYNTFDVLMCCSKREGFGLPILEAMACAKPVIAHNYSSMTELVGRNEERGWLCRTACKYGTGIGGISGIPDVDDIERCIYRAYFNPDEVEEKGRRALRFARKFTWSRLVKWCWVPLLDKILERLDTLPST